MPTISELRFEQFCCENSIQFIVVPCESRAQVQTPDYEIFPTGHKIAVEIKELTANKEERDLIDKAFQDGAASGWCDPSSRIRQKISDAAKQLKSRTKSEFPGMLVLFDNGTFGGIAATDIKNAMYGHGSVRVIRSESQIELEPRLGGGRKCTADHNTSLSAVALLLGSRMLVFHHIFARIPIPAAWLEIQNCAHFSIGPDVRQCGSATARFPWLINSPAHKRRASNA